MPTASHQSRATVCHVGNSLLLRADSTGVGELRLKPGPKLVLIGAAACTTKKMPKGKAPVQTCTVGNQEYVLDSAGVGDSTGVGGDSTGVGELSFDMNHCKWVAVAGSAAKALECLYGPVVFHIDTAGIREGSARTASRR